jgi:hypothetical protein
MRLSQISYDFSKTSKVELLDPITNKPFEEPAFINVFSQESKQGKLAQLSIYREILAEKEKLKDDEEISEEKLKEINIKNLCTLIESWEGITDDNGNEIEFSQDIAKELLTEYDVIYNAVNIGVSSLGNFQKK